MMVPSFGKMNEFADFKFVVYPTYNPSDIVDKVCVDYRPAASGLLHDIIREWQDAPGCYTLRVEVDGEEFWTCELGATEQLYV